MSLHTRMCAYAIYIIQGLLRAVGRYSAAQVIPLLDHLSHCNHRSPSVDPSFSYFLQEHAFNIEILCKKLQI
jgi:hypothetical protein